MLQVLLSQLASAAAWASAAFPSAADHSRTWQALHATPACFQFPY